MTKRYSPDQARDPKGRFGSGGGGSAKGFSHELKHFAISAAVAVAALALKRFGWKKAPAWLKQIARKSLRSAEDPTPDEIDQLMGELTPEQKHQLADDMIGALDDTEREALLNALHEGQRDHTGEADMRVNDPTIEHRAAPTTFEFAESDAAIQLRGHAAVFNQLSHDLGGFREQIAPGSFADAIGSDDVRALFNHDPNFVLGRSKAGTLKLSEDQRGLAFSIDMPKTQTVRDLVVEPIKRGDISQMSFQFAVRKNGDEWAKAADGSVVRTLRSVRLLDISPVTFPAYPQTDVAVRSLRAFEQTLRTNPTNLLRAKELLARV